MDLIETIASNIPDAESFRNLAVLFQDLPDPKLEVKKYGRYNHLLFKDDTLQKNEFVRTGEKIEEIRYKNGKRDGKYNLWYANGEKKSEGQYTNGIKEGHWTFWYDNGVVRDEGDYVNDKENGLWLGRYWSGEKSHERFFHGGKLHGINTFYNDDGTIQFQVEYLDGRYIKKII